jgi:hypothetical protein
MSEPTGWTIMLRLSKGILYLEAKALISSGIVFFASVEALVNKTKINDIRRNVFLLTQRLSIKEVYL